MEASRGGSSRYRHRVEKLGRGKNDVSFKGSKGVK